MTPSDRTSRSAGSAATPSDRDALTTDDLRHKALAVRDVATNEVRKLAQARRTQIVLAVALGCAVALSIAYLAGSKAGARQARRRR